MLLAVSQTTETYSDYRLAVSTNISLANMNVANTCFTPYFKICNFCKTFLNVIIVILAVVIFIIIIIIFCL